MTTPQSKDPVASQPKSEASIPTAKDQKTQSSVTAKKETPSTQSSKQASNPTPPSAGDKVAPKESYPQTSAPPKVQAETPDTKPEDSEEEYESEEEDEEEEEDEDNSEVEEVPTHPPQEAHLPGADPVVTREPAVNSQLQANPDTSLSTANRFQILQDLDTSHHTSPASQTQDQQEIPSPNVSLPSPTTSNLPDHLPQQELVLKLIDKLGSSHKRNPSLTRFPVKPTILTQSTVPAMSTPPMDNTALTLYEPPTYDVVMSEPGDEPPMSQVSVRNPPEWLITLHHDIGQTYHDLVTFAQQIENRDQVTAKNIEEQYNIMAENYRWVLQLYREGHHATEEQIARFQGEVAEASYQFSQKVWGTIAKFARDDEARQQAITRLEQIADSHHQALLEIERRMLETQAFKSNVGEWAAQKESQINDLLAREYLDPASIDRQTRRQVEELRSYTQDALAEFQRQLRSDPHAVIDVNSVLQQIGQRAATRPPSSRFVSQPSSSRTPGIPGTRASVSKYSSSEARIRNSLTNRALQTAQAKRTAQGARWQFDTSRGSPFMSGGNGLGGTPPPPPRNPGAPGDPDSDPDDDDGSDDQRGPPPPPPGRGPPRGSSRRPPDEPESGRWQDRLVLALERLGRPAPATVNPVQLSKPQTYDGKDLSKFRPWWIKVESYLETYAESFPQDYHRINWVGSLLTDKAQTWHQQRLSQVRRVGLTDRWDGYVIAITERFKDPSEKHRNVKKMKSLTYQGDTVQYLTELLDLNEVVQWSGVTFQNHISQTLPDEITRLVYSRQGAMPDSDEDFLAAIQEAGQIYENMLSNPGISSGKGRPDSTSEHSKSGQNHQGKETRSTSGQSRSSKSQPKDRQKSEAKPKLDPKDKKWPNIIAALKGIEQGDIDQRKKDKVSCWRCGRDNHHTLACFAKKDVKGKDLPSPPEKISSAKRKRDDDTPAPSSEKKLKIDAALREPDHAHLVTELDDSDSDF
ncbi:hypothetical protein SLS62_003686 [Diatrype stigma]|uniref:Uncharacterized protein n=1 Tax=Diatrype stigma TaxID=117547 RepID=A0AAN9UUM4_9PEZI